MDIIFDVAFCVELATKRQLAYLFWASLCSLLSSTIVNTYSAFLFLAMLTKLDEDGDGDKEVLKEPCCEFLK